MKTRRLSLFFLPTLIGVIFGANVFAAPPGFEGISGGGSSAGGDAPTFPPGGDGGICCYPDNGFHIDQASYSVSFDIKYNTVNDGSYPYSVSSGVATIDPESSIDMLHVQATYVVSNGVSNVGSDTITKPINVSGIEPGRSLDVLLYSYDGDEYTPYYHSYYDTRWCDASTGGEHWTGHVGWCGGIGRDSTTGELDGDRAYPVYGTPLTFSMRVTVYRSAEGVYGIKSVIEYDEVSEEDKANGTPSEGAGKYSATAYAASPNRDYHQTVTDTYFHNEDGHLVSNNDLTRTFFMHSDESYSFKTTFNSYIYRGLNTRYDSYNPSHQRIDSTWSINRTNLGANSSGGITSMAPPTTREESLSADGLTSLANLSPVNTSGTGEKTYTISNDPSKQYHVGLGESKDFCEIASHPAIIIIGPAGWSSKDENLKNRACIRANRPWNFDLSISTYLNDNNGENILVIDGGGGNYGVDITNTYDEATHGSEPNKDGSYQTRSPAGTKLRVYTFQLGEDTPYTVVPAIDASLNSTGRIIGAGNIESYLFGTLIPSSAGTNLSGASNLLGYQLAISEDYTDGVGFSGEAENHMSADFDVKSSEINPGTKFCVVAAINYVNSGHTEQPQGYGNATGGNDWLISNISCRSTSSKSSFQITGGDITAGGIVDVASTRITMGGTTVPIGSWVDYGLVGNGAIIYGQFAGLASGAYGTYGRADVFSNDACSISPMTITNFGCLAPGADSTGSIGGANIHYGEKIINTLNTKYSSSASIVGVSMFDIPDAGENFVNLHYVDADGSEVPTDEDNPSINPVSGKYYFLSDLKDRSGRSINGEISTGTEIIRVTDNAGLIIDHDLEYTHKIYLNPHDIPQRIIIVEGGNVVISSNVENVDAWIVVRDGNLVTCVDSVSRIPGQRDYDIQSKEVRDYEECRNQLNINGYVAANFIDFTRTFYYTANDLADIATHPDGLYGNYGERITLPYSSMIWAYNKLYVSSISQPSVVYTHTLAPRY